MDAFTFITNLTGKLDGAGYSDTSWSADKERITIRVRDKGLEYLLAISITEINYSIADLSEYCANKIIRAFEDKAAERAAG